MNRKLYVLLYFPLLISFLMLTVLAGAIFVADEGKVQFSHTAQWLVPMAIVFVGSLAFYGHSQLGKAK